MTGFIFLGINNNTEDKVTTFTMLLTADLIGHLANLGILLLIKMDLQLHTPMYSFLSHPSLCVSAIPLQFTPRCSQTYFPRFQNLFPFQWLLLSNSWSSVSLQIVSISGGSDGQGPVQSHQQPLALCGQQVQQGGLPAHGWGFPGGNDRCSETHGITIPLMFLCVK